MAFVNEEIPEDDKKKLDPNVFKMRFGGSPVRLTSWTVDRDRDAFLIFLEGSGPDGVPEFYAFGWQGYVVKFCAHVTGKGNFEIGREFVWDVFQVGIPPELEAHRSEILDAIRESIDAHGRYYKRQSITSVTVNIR